MSEPATPLPDLLDVACATNCVVQTGKLVAWNYPPSAVLQGQDFEHVAMPRAPSMSAADTYGSGYLDSLMSHQVNACRCQLHKWLSCTGCRHSQVLFLLFCAYRLAQLPAGSLRPVALPQI